jgi:hypothetical protein
MSEDRVTDDKPRILDITYGDVQPGDSLAEGVLVVRYCSDGTDVWFDIDAGPDGPTFATPMDRDEPIRVMRP